MPKPRGQPEIKVNKRCGVNFLSRIQTVKEIQSVLDERFIPLKNK